MPSVRSLISSWSAAGISQTSSPSVISDIKISKDQKHNTELTATQCAVRHLFILSLSLNYFFWGGWYQQFSFLWQRAEKHLHLRRGLALVYDIIQRLPYASSLTQHTASPVPSVVGMLLPNIGSTTSRSEDFLTHAWCLHLSWVYSHTSLSPLSWLASVPAEMLCYVLSVYFFACCADVHDAWVVHDSWLFKLDGGSTWCFKPEHLNYEGQGERAKWGTSPLTARRRGLGGVMLWSSQPDPRATSHLEPFLAQPELVVAHCCRGNAPFRGQPVWGGFPPSSTCYVVSWRLPLHDLMNQIRLCKLRTPLPYPTLNVMA